MEDLLNRLPVYNQLCLRMLPDFWGFTLTRTPELEYARNKTGLISEGRIRVSEHDLETYLTNLSDRTQKPETAFFHFSAHTLNRVFALSCNDRLTDALLFPAHQTKRTSIVEAVASVATCWAIDHWHQYQNRQPEDGHQVILHYYDLWTEHLCRRTACRATADQSLRQYEELKRLEIPAFRNFVKSYKPNTN